jgi:hypothetical protein
VVDGVETAGTQELVSPVPGDADSARPLSLASWPTSDPTGPVAAATTTVPPAGWPIVNSPE